MGIKFGECWKYSACREFFVYLNGYLYNNLHPVFAIFLLHLWIVLHNSGTNKMGNIYCLIIFLKVKRVHNSGTRNWKISWHVYRSCNDHLRPCTDENWLADRRASRFRTDERPAGRSLSRSARRSPSHCSEQTTIPARRSVSKWHVTCQYIMI